MKFIVLNSIVYIIRKDIHFWTYYLPNHVGSNMSWCPIHHSCISESLYLFRIHFVYSSELLQIPRGDIFIVNFSKKLSVMLKLMYLHFTSLPRVCRSVHTS